MLLLFIPCAAVVILFPSLTTDAARLVGVGRGADLLLYGVTMVLIFLLFNNYIKDRENQRKMVELARMLAILDAQINNKK